MNIFISESAIDNHDSTAGWKHKDYGDPNLVFQNQIRILDYIVIDMKKGKKKVDNKTLLNKKQTLGIICESNLGEAWE